MLLWILLGLLLVFLVLCAIFRDLLYMAISLALASIILAIVLFHYGANIAGVFELSVCAGLITVLFVSTVSLTKDSDQKVESRVPVYFLPFIILLFLGLDFFIVRWLSGTILPKDLTQQAASTATFQSVFWTERTADMLGQIGLILAGVFGILALFRVASKEKQHE